MQELIEYILVELNIEYDCRDEYIHTHNPFIEDSIKSCTIFYNDGTMQIYNGCINNKSRLTLKEWCISLGFGNEYVEYMLKHHDIPIYKFNRYKELIQKKAFGEYYNFKELNSFREIMKELYLKDSEVLGLSSSKPVVKKYNKKSERKKSKISEKKLTQSQQYNILRYMSDRQLYASKTCYPTLVNINDSFDIKAVCFEYPNGFKKYRFLSNGLRYLSNGDYKTLYECRVGKSNTAIISEGEIECHSLENVVDSDLYALHNVNSVSIQNNLSCYDNVVVFLDNDKYDEVKEKVANDIKSVYSGSLYILPKFISSDKTLDFNSYLINEGLENFKKYFKKHLTDNNISSIIGIR